jgi:hypothetical protein
MRRLSGLGAALLLVTCVVLACDHGAAMLVENQADQDYIVRVGGNTFVAGNSSTEPYHWVPAEVVTVAPANSKRVVYMIPFHGGLEPAQLDILRRDCTPIYAQPFIETDGTYLVIDDNAVVSIRKEFPQKGEPAPSTTACATLATESIAPTGSPSPSGSPAPPS